MFCQNCGKEISDGVKFCPYCGQALNQSTGQAAVVNHIGTRKIKQQKGMNVSGYAATKKNSLAPLGLLLVLVLGGIALIFSFVMQSRSKELPYILIKNDKILMSNDASKDKEIELGQYRYEYSYGLSVAYSPDNKYLYFKETPRNEYYGNLCCAEWRKLKVDTDKNEEYINRIATDVSTFEILDDGTVLYYTENGSLYAYDGKNQYLIADSVYRHFILDDGTMLCMTNEFVDYDANDMIGLHIYKTDVKNPQSKTLIADDVMSCYVLDGKNNIVILRQYSDDYENGYIGSLYSIGADMKENLICEHAYSVSQEGDKLYYLEETAESIEWQGQVMPVKRLCCFENGAVQVVAESIVNWADNEGTIVYNTEDMVLDKIRTQMNSSDFGIEDFYNAVMIDPTDPNYVFLTKSGTTLQITQDVANQFPLYDGEYQFFKCLSLDENLFFQAPDNSIWELSDKNGLIDEAKKIADDAILYGYGNGALYYASDITYGADGMYIDLYSYKNHMSNSLVRDNFCDGITLYDDDTILLLLNYGGYGSTDQELTMITPEGQLITVGTSVSDYVREDDGNIFYIADKELYKYTDKGSELINTGVKAIQSPHQTEGTWLGEYMYEDND